MPDRPLRVAACAVALVPILAGSAVAAGREDPVERAVADAVSQERAKLGLPGLTMLDVLARAADRHSRAMAQTGVLSHGAFVRRLAPIVPGRRMGETIAFVSGRRRGLARRVVQGWLTSPAHRAILLDPALLDVGIGRRSNRSGWFFTADFAGR